MISPSAANVFCSVMCLLQWMNEAKGDKGEERTDKESRNTI